MALYQIRYACGHTAEKQLYGKTADRERYVDWAARHGACAACSARAEAAGVEALEAEYGLPALTGSDKQVGWARRVRAELLRGAQSEIDSMRCLVKPGMEALFDEQAGVVLVAMAERTAASWWIDRRDTHPRTLMDAVFAEARKC